MPIRATENGLYIENKVEAVTETKAWSRGELKQSGSGIV